MAEPVPQVVAQMPKAKLIGLLTLFLGPAVVVYTAFSIYPLLATMQLATFTGESGGGVHFVGLANFRTLLTDALWSQPFWNAFKNNMIFFAIHMAVEIRSALSWLACSACPD